jgi:hypothetical protein
LLIEIRFTEISVVVFVAAPERGAVAPDAVMISEFSSLRPSMKLPE